MMKLATNAEGETLSLNHQAVTQRTGFIGTIGGGKTYGATKLAELMLDAGAQIVAIDPVGVWYGLRAKGTGPGYNIPVFGGLHGDVPLEVGAGAIIADLIVDQNISAVIDLSQFEFDTDRARFCTEFGRRFFYRKNQKPSAVHLFIEEAQEILPEEPQRNEMLMRHAFVRMAKLGRNYGIGISLITQRPQDVSKKALNLCEVVFAFKLNGPHERAAVKRWITDKGDADTITDQLPYLAVGQCRVVSREWLKINETIKILPKQTADVSSTPQHGSRKIKARDLSAIDLAGLRTKMAATIERAKADDPKELKKEIAKLKHELAAANRAKPQLRLAAPAPKTVIKQVGASEAKAMEKAAKMFVEASQKASEVVAQLHRIITPPPELPARHRVLLHTRPFTPPEVRPHPPARPTAPASGQNGAIRLPDGERRLAILIAQNEPRGVMRNQLAGLSGFKRKTCNEYSSRLKRSGVIEDGADGRMHVTPAGVEALGDYERLPEGAELIAYWLAKLPEGEGKIFRIIAADADGVTKQMLVDQTGFAPKTCNEYLSRIKRREIIQRVGAGTLKLADHLLGA